MNYDQARALAPLLQKAVDKIKVSDHNYKITVDTNDDSPLAAVFTVTVFDQDEITAGAEEFKNGAKEHGLEPEDLGLVIYDRMKQFTIIGADWSDRKYPIITMRESTNGKPPARMVFNLAYLIEAKKRTLETRERFKETKSQEVKCEA